MVLLRVPSVTHVVAQQGHFFKMMSDIGIIAGLVVGPTPRGIFICLQKMFGTEDSH